MHKLVQSLCRTSEANITSYVNYISVFKNLVSARLGQSLNNFFPLPPFPPVNDSGGKDIKSHSIHPTT